MENGQQLNYINFMLDMSDKTITGDTFHLVYKFKNTGDSPIQKALTEIFAFNRRILNDFVESCTLDIGTPTEAEVSECEALNHSVGWRDTLGVNNDGDARLNEPNIELTDSSQQEFSINLEQPVFISTMFVFQYGKD